jgi:hypothetical protein
MIIQIWDNDGHEKLEEFQFSLKSKNDFVYWIENIGKVIVGKIISLYHDGNV